MSILNKLTLKNLKLNKKRTIVTVIGIILSVALITAVSTLYFSAIYSLITFETHEKGFYHVAYYDVLEEDLDVFKNNRSIEELYYTKNIGYAKLNDSKNNYKPYAFIKAFTSKSLDNLSVQLVEGRLPYNDSEILIPTHLKTNGRIELNVGDEITLEVGTRTSEDGYILNQSNPFTDENEIIINKTTKKYKVVGKIERPASNIEDYSAPGYTFITYLDEKNISGNIDIYCKYTKKGIKNYEEVTANILGVDEYAYKKILRGDYDSSEEFDKYIELVSDAKYEVNINSYLITLQSNIFEESTSKGLGVVVLIICAIIVFTSVFCIKNSFDISITEKIRQYGMLKSIGATKKQIRKNVLYEATILGVFGIPLGLLFGLIASAILIVVTNYLLGASFEDGLYLSFKVSYLCLLFSIGLGIITIYLSALRSARKASKVSPIESIRNSMDIKQKRIKSSKLINKLFGIGGLISYKNLKRNKKKYRTTVISMVVSVFVFIALSSFIEIAFKYIKHDVSLSSYNLNLIVNQTSDKDVYNKVIETTLLDGIKEYSIIKSSIISLDNVKFTKRYKEYIDIDNDNNLAIFALNNEAYKKYLKKIGQQYDSMKDKVILVDYAEYYNSDKKTFEKFNKYDYKVNDKLTGLIDDEIKTPLNIGYITDIMPFGLDNYEKVYLVMSEDMFNALNIYSKYVEVYFNTENATKLQDDIDKVLKTLDYSTYNIDEEVQMIKNFYILIAIFLYGFIIVISLIGITNIFNTITTNMELRRQEFAMLKSIGMTKKEFNHMIRLETVFMGTKSLLFGIPIGIALSYLIYKKLTDGSALSYSLPITAIIISIFVVFLLITCIMKYSMSKINKQNTIETIRNENI